MKHKHSYMIFKSEDFSRMYCECGKAGKKIPTHTLKPYRNDPKRFPFIDCHTFNISGTLTKIPHSHLEASDD